jgi:hypothetical protein
MLDKLFPTFFSSSDKGGTNLSSGGTPTHLQGNDKEAFASYSTIPGKLTQPEVNKMAASAGQGEATIAMMKTWSEHALAAQSQALSALDVRINHAQASMKNEELYRKKISKHGKNVLAHRIDVGATKANLDAYQAALNTAQETIAL